MVATSHEPPSKLYIGLLLEPYQVLVTCVQGLREGSGCTSCSCQTWVVSRVAKLEIPKNQSPSPDRDPKSEAPQKDPKTGPHICRNSEVAYKCAGRPNAVDMQALP